MALAGKLTRMGGLHIKSQFTEISFRLSQNKKISSIYCSNGGSFQSPKQTLISSSADKPGY